MELMAHGVSRTIIRLTGDALPWVVLGLKPHARTYLSPSWGLNPRYTSPAKLQSVHPLTVAGLLYDC